MASSQPIVRQINWLTIFPQIVVLAIFYCFYYLLDIDGPLLVATVTYLIISIGLKQGVPVYHRNGIKYCKRAEYDKAIVEFERSYNFFKKHQWIDRYRFLILLSSRRISYTEMALLNIAFSYGQLGNGEKSKEFY